MSGDELAESVQEVDDADVDDVVDASDADVIDRARALDHGFQLGHPPGSSPRAEAAPPSESAVRPDDEAPTHAVVSEVNAVAPVSQSVDRRSTPSASLPSSKPATGPKSASALKVGAAASGERETTDDDPEMEGMPKRFGKYTLIRKLAVGGMAELFLAIQKSVAGFEKLLVIKRILPSMNHNQAFVDMLLHEARIAATLSHPNIVQIFDVGQTEGQYFIAMEHVHGEDLRSIVRQMKKKSVFEFPIEHALAIVLGMCAGLAYAHEKRDLDGSEFNIVHRDISPQNVVVTFTGDVKIVDFGIAKSDNRAIEDTKSGKLKGKVPYMSPEQARGEAVDARSDVFSTGVMLFELTTGKRLFKGQSEYETLRLICDREYPLPTSIDPDYPSDLEAIVMKALAKDKAERYQSARELQADIEAFVRRHQIAVSNIALHQFMQSLFEEKLAAQKEALLAGKQLADIIDMTHPLPSQADGEADGSGLSNVVRVSTLTGGVNVAGPAASMATVTDLSSPKHQRKKAGQFGLAMLALGAIGAAAGSVGFYFFAGSKTDPPSETKPEVTTSAPGAPAAAKGSLVIESTPPGASIWINGDLRPEVTPATIAQLPTGVPLDVKLTMEGFEQSKQQLSLKEGAPANVRAELKRGSVRVDLRVEPAGINPTIALDGKVVPGPYLEGLASGTLHKVVVTAPGYVDRTITFSGAPLETKRLEVTLEKLGDPAKRPNHAAPSAPTTDVKPPSPPPVGQGKLNVGASNGWCNVTVDGAARGATPVAGLELSAGMHRVTCTTPEDKTLSATVPVPADGVARHKFTL